MSSEKKQSIFCEISTPPKKSAWSLKEGISIFNYLAVHLIWILRIFSLLQFIKFLIRKSFPKEVKSSSPKRSPIPAFITESYFIAVLLVVLYLIFLKDYHQFYPLCNRIIVAYILVETTVWNLYYYIFRLFIEGKDDYEANNDLYHFLRLFFVGIIQILCLSFIHNENISTVIDIFIGKHETSFLYIYFLKVFYFIIAIGIVISNFPKERKKENT